MKYDVIFWDWNGTIIDDVEICMETVNSLLKEYGKKPFSARADYHKVFRFPIIDYYRDAGFDFDEVPFDVLAHKYIARYDVNCRRAKIFPDILNVLCTFKRDGIKQIMLTASEKNDLIRWLDEIDALKFFDDIIANDDIYAAGKADIAKRWLKKHPEINLERAVMVGDTTHDVEVARAMGIDAVTIARGHGARVALEKTGAPVFDNADEMQKYFEN